MGRLQHAPLASNSAPTVAALHQRAAGDWPQQVTTVLDPAALASMCTSATCSTTDTTLTKAFLLHSIERYSSLCEVHLRATERHLPCGITQCYLPPDTGERQPSLNPSQTDEKLSSPWCWSKPAEGPPVPLAGSLTYAQRPHARYENKFSSFKKHIQNIN